MTLTPRVNVDEVDAEIVVVAGSDMMHEFYTEAEVCAGRLEKPIGESCRDVITWKKIRSGVDGFRSESVRP